MNPEQFERLLDRLMTVRNTDDLLNIELGLGVLDEEDPRSARALYQLASMRCHLSGGPAPAPDRFTLARPAPEHCRERFEIRGRIDTRVVRVGWADGALFGSLYALARIHRGDEDGFKHASTARARIVGHLDVVLDEVQVRAVA